MSLNKHKPHLYLVPEDRRDHQIANGFERHARVTRQIKILDPAGGWTRVLDTFKEEYIPLLRQNANAHVVLLIDFDGNPAERRQRFESETPEDLRSRVFVVGPRDTPESLRQSLGRNYEAIGSALADDCDRDAVTIWGHEQLQHNERDRLRLVQAVKPFLFAKA